MRTTPLITPLRRQCGATLIEVLVSFVIFSFGILGLVGLQSKLLVYNQSSLFRSQATALADDVLERMRLDSVNVKVGAASVWNTTDVDTVSSGSLDTNAELKDWKKQIEALLPNGTAKIEISDPPNNEVRITLTWTDNRSGANTASQQQAFETVSRL